jgi:hypothetical protein
MSEFDPSDATLSELADWLEKKEGNCRAVYKSNPETQKQRERDIHLGKLRAYRDAKRVVLEMAARQDNEANHGK